MARGNRRTEECRISSAIQDDDQKKVPEMQYRTLERDKREDHVPWVLYSPLAFVSQPSPWAVHGLNEA